MNESLNSTTSVRPEVDRGMSSGRRPIVVHVPHSSTVIPVEVRHQILLNDQQLADELLRMTDRYTAELFTVPATIGTTIVYEVSRLVVDPERFLDDSMEPMVQKGMGVIYTRTSRGEVLRGAIPDDQRRWLIDRYYRPHHERLIEEVKSCIDESGTCLIIDGHSFSSVPLPHEPDQDPDRPDICIGVDEFHTPEELREAAVAAYRDKGYSVAVNRPFAGSLVPAPFYRHDPRVRSVMVEINRRLYMGQDTGEKLGDFERVRDDNLRCTHQICSADAHVRYR